MSFAVDTSVLWTPSYCRLLNTVDSLILWTPRYSGHLGTMHRESAAAAAQGRPTEAALLTALLSPDPARRPPVDDVLRSGLLRQLHSSLTSLRPSPGSPRPQSPPPVPGDSAMCRCSTSC